MNERERLRQVVEWLSDLANVTAGNAPLADSKAKIGSMASMLVTKFPIEAFCRSSLDHVAQESRFFPPYADVMKHLGIWMRDRRPAQPVVAAPPADWHERHGIPKPREAPTEAEKSAVSEVLANWRMEVATRKSQPLAAEPQPTRPAAVLSDEQLAAMHEAAGNKIRADALRAKIAAAAKIVPFPAPAA